MRECSEQAARAPQGGARWYAVYTKPHEEQRAESNLRAWGVETFAPQVREGSEGRRVRPLFSRYVFARFEAERQLQKVSYTRGVSCVVTSGGRPLEVCEEVMDVLRSRMGESGCVRLGEELLAGDAVEIQGGALYGLNGIFKAGLKDQERVRILLTAVKYQAQVTVERLHLKKLSHA